jgi:anti-anti-sigma factor
MMLLAVERVDGVVVARPRFDVDAAVVAAMREELAASLGPETVGVALDLSEVRYVDSAGLDMIFRLSERLAQARSALVVVIPEGSQLERLAAIVALPHAVRIKGSLEEALRELAELAGLPASVDGAGSGEDTVKSGS